MAIDLFQLTAERVHKVPAGWRWCGLDAHDKPEDFIEVRGGVPVGFVTRGRRKGAPKWPKPLTTLWMRQSEMDQVAADWEAENGKCHRCEGSGQELAGYSVHDGARHRDCSRCGATGKPGGSSK